MPVLSNLAPARLLDPKYLGGLEGYIQMIQARVIGQPEASEAIVSSYIKWFAGLSREHRPVGALLFVGPTGAGKTHTVKMAAEIITGNENALIRVDCGEFQHSHEVAKLIGAPPGYLGHRETLPIITEKKLQAAQTDKCKMNFVLFDEVDKAHPSILSALLGIMDNASLRLGDNTLVDFSNTLLVMTANTGSQEIAQELSGGFGFTRSGQEIGKLGLGAARKSLTPEFFNRLTKVVIFSPLSLGDIRQILDLEISALQTRVANSKVPFVFRVSGEAREFLLHEGYESRYGARHLQRTLDLWLTLPFANLLASQQIRLGTVVSVSLIDNKITYIAT